MIDIFCPHGAQQQTRQPPLLLSIDGTDKQTDRRTPDRYVDRAPHTLRTASIIYGWPLDHIFPRKIRVPLFIIEAFQVTTLTC